MTPRALLVTVALLASGCASESVRLQPERLNSCVSNADCPVGVCESDGTESLCVATHSELQHLFLELDVPNNAAVAAGLHSVRPAAAFGLNLQGDSPQGFIHGVALSVGQPIEVFATLTVTELPTSCEALSTGDSIRSTIELHPVGQPVGVSLAPYSGQHDDARGGPHVLIPQGTYDIYLKPDIEAAPGCTLPPVLIKRQVIENYTELRYTRSEPATLVGHLDVPHPPECDTDPSRCWRVELLDNERGRVVGGALRLEAEGELQTERFVLQFWQPDIDASTTIDPVLVIHPPTSMKQVGMPDLFWKLAAIDPFGDLDVSLQVATLAAATSRFIALEASVRTPEGEPVPANVIISSRQLLGGTYGDNALYQTAVTTDKAGNFAANILPGNYDIVAIPGANSNHAVTVKTWTFGDGDLGKGRTFEVKPVSRVLGSARTPMGEVAANIAAQLAPSATEDVSLLEAAFSPGQSFLLASLPRTSTAYTNAVGAFELPLDPGFVDLSLRPSSTTNLPWLVRRNIFVAASEPQVLELGELTFTAPVVLVGTVVTTDGTSVADVTIRAWLASEPSDADARPSAIGLGEATSDASGHSRLLLPASASE